MATLPLAANSTTSTKRRSPLHSKGCNVRAVAFATARQNLLHCRPGNFHVLAHRDLGTLCSERGFSGKARRDRGRAPGLNGNSQTAPVESRRQFANGIDRAQAAIGGLAFGAPSLHQIVKVARLCACCGCCGAQVDHFNLIKKRTLHTNPRVRASDQSPAANFP